MVWNSRVRLTVWQTWWVGQDVIRSPGSCRGIGVLPPGIWAALVKLDQRGLQSGYLIALRTDTPVSSSSAPGIAPCSVYSVLLGRTGLGAGGGKKEAVPLSSGVQA